MILQFRNFDGWTQHESNEVVHENSVEETIQLRNHSNGGRTDHNHRPLLA